MLIKHFAVLQLCSSVSTVESLGQGLDRIDATLHFEQISIGALVTHKRCEGREETLMLNEHMREVHSNERSWLFSRVFGLSDVWKSCDKLRESLTGTIKHQR
jgi:hypothetical protein